MIDVCKCIHVFYYNCIKGARLCSVAVILEASGLKTPVKWRDNRCSTFHDPLILLSVREYKDDCCVSAITKCSIFIMLFLVQRVPEQQRP